MKRSLNNKVRRLSIQELKERVAQSEMDYKKGKYKTSEELLSKYK